MMAGPISSTTGIAAGFQSIQNRTNQSATSEETDTVTTPEGAATNTDIETTEIVEFGPSELIEQSLLQGLDINQSFSEEDATQQASALGQSLGLETLSIANNRLDTISPLFTELT
ncbi:hypothetical protein [Kordiimonas sp. SCSIO 12610]|uniref:hypothetical protein n=1 Tax=Kordiimonas sp. SCSIO 12610 TaxID=2829597 RepID=UPI00210B570D|nr:hypothetical protein [Kordiimonas sp. SCSIO 12610]UTW54827.1 hypothetical protein KFF44_13590 [Kordiimonas sp. SCSIO 12610]